MVLKALQRREGARRIDWGAFQGNGNLDTFISHLFGLCASTVVLVSYWFIYWIAFACNYLTCRFNLMPNSNPQPLPVFVLGFPFAALLGLSSWVRWQSKYHGKLILRGEFQFISYFFGALHNQYTVKTFVCYVPGQGKTARGTKTKCQPVSLSLCLFVLLHSTESKDRLILGVLRSVAPSCWVFE